MIHISTPSNRFPEERGSVTVTLPTEPAPVRFVALDVETATRAGEICQVGLAVFADGQLTASMNTLVRPRRNVFDPRCSMVHGITAADTKKAPTFAEIWAELKLYLDTHPEDAEAFAALQTCLRLSCEGRKRYVKQYGAITIDDMRYADSFTWVDAPWPWQWKED